LCCRNEFGKGTTEENSAGYWGALGPCDVPWVLFLLIYNF